MPADERDGRGATSRRPARPPVQHMKDVVVIGAGVAGVTAARELRRAGFSACVVEGRERLGGRVHSIRDFCERPVEAGAEFVHGSGAATWPELRAHGLEARPCHLVRHTMLSVGGRARWIPWLLMDPRLWPSFTIFPALSRFRAPDASAREFVERRRYRGRARILAETTLCAHLPGDAEEISVQGLVEDGVLVLESGLNHRVLDGYDSLPRLIARDLDVRLGFRVAAVHWLADSVRVRSTDGREIAARSAICTLPVGVLKSGSVSFLPALPEAKRAALEHIVMGPVLKVLLRFAERFWPSWTATIACGTGPVTLYWPVFHGRSEGPHVLTAYCTGPRAAALSALGEEQALDVVLADLHRLFPKSDPRHALVSNRRIDWSRDPFSCGGYTFVRPGGAGARAKLRAADTGALFWAGSATERSPIAATVEAAYTSGLRAAGEARALLEGL